MKKMARTMTSSAAMHIPGRPAPAAMTSPTTSDVSGSYIGSVMSGRSSFKRSLTLSSMLTPEIETKLMRARKMSEAMQSPTKQAQRMLMGTPTAPEDISKVWAVPVINQYLLKHGRDLIQSEAQVTTFELKAFKTSVGDFSSTFKLDVTYESGGNDHDVSFVIKLLPLDDPGRVYVFEANLLEKEIDMYFEILPAINLFMNSGTANSTFMEDLVPECVYGSHNMQGSGALVFTSCVEKGFAHSPDAAGLSLETTLTVARSAARFHASARAFVARSGESAVRRRYPCLTQDMYSNELFRTHAENHLSTFEELLHAAPEMETVEARKVLMALQDMGVAEMCKGLRRQSETVPALNTVVHGELWEKNVLLNETRPDRCMLLDWKSAKLGSCTLDLAFLLFSSASLDVLESGLRSVFTAYSEEFSSALHDSGSTSERAPTVEEIEEDFGLSVMPCLMQALLTISGEMQHLEGQLRGEDAEDADVAAKTAQMHAYERRALDLLELPAVADLMDLSVRKELREATSISP